MHLTQTHWGAQKPISWCGIEEKQNKEYKGTAFFRISSTELNAVFQKRQLGIMGEMLTSKVREGDLLEAYLIEPPSSLPVFQSEKYYISQNQTQGQRH